MNPHGFTLLYLRRHRTDHRFAVRREDEEPLDFIVSNLTYRLVMAGERGLRRWYAWRNREWPW